jgi:hypothetical protein
MNLFDIKFLLALYLVQLTSLTNNTLGKQLKEYVYSNRMIQHIINIVFLIVLISMLDDQRSLTNITISSLVLYIIYIFTTKLDLQYNLLILAFALFYYFYKREVNKQIKRISDDNDIDSNLKNMIVKLDENKEMIFGSGLLLVLAYFVYIYVSRKSVQYGGGFSYSKFLIY